MENLRGNVALTTVLVFSALFVFTAIVLIFQALYFANSTTSYTNQIYAQNTAFTCLEEAYYKISRNNPAYANTTTESFSVVIDADRECSATVVKTSGNNRVINVESQYRSSSYNTQKIIADITATEWVIN